jgi:O-antigen ligase
MKKFGSVVRNGGGSRRFSESAGGTSAGDRVSAMFIGALFWVLIVFLVIPPNDYLLEPKNAVYTAAPNPIFRTIKIALLLVGAYVVFRRSRLAASVYKQLNRFFVVCLGLMTLSVAWSTDRDLTVAHLMSLASLVLPCCALVLVGWNLRRFQSVTRPVITLLLIGSIAFALAYPDLAIESGEGTLKDAWRGLTAQKNQFGMLSAAAYVLWLHALLTKEGKSLIALLGVGLSGYCVLLSRSSSSLLSSVLTTMFMVILLFAPKSSRRLTPYIVAGFSAIVLIYAVAVLKLVPGLDMILRPVASLTGKDLTFSNRSDIWVIIKEHIDLRPFLGSGYGAYWGGMVPSSPSFVFLARMYFYPFESHNGYLEVANDLGFVGLFCLIGYLVNYIKQALELMKFERNQAILYLCVFFQQAVSNLSESFWLQVGFATTLMSLATLCVARTLYEKKRQAAMSRAAVSAAAPSAATVSVPNPNRPHNPPRKFGGRRVGSR